MILLGMGELSGRKRGNGRRGRGVLSRGGAGATRKNY